MTEMWKISGRLGNQMFQTAFLYAKMIRGEISDIYLQDEKYFEDCSGFIRHLYSEGIHFGSEPFISIHVRRGDYVKNPFYVDLSTTDYYKKAMSLFPGENFLVFSDDIEWCKKLEMFKSCQFSEGLNEIEDFNRMASCRGHIMANSSFSWWAAWLSGFKTVAPIAWFTDGKQRVGLPSHWIKI